jgi:hypothetical protein
MLFTTSITMKNKRLIPYLICLLAVFTGFAQTPAGTNATPNTSNTVSTNTSVNTTDSAKKPKAATTIQVVSVSKYFKKKASNSQDTISNIFPGDYLIVAFNRKDLDTVRKNFTRYRLWIDGICFPNMKPLFINESRSGLVFRLERDTAQNSPWQLYYSNPNYWKTHRNSVIKLGTLTKEYQPIAKPHTINLYTSHLWMRWIFYPAFILLLLVVIRYGQALLKDTALFTSRGATITFKTDEATDAAKGIINIKQVPYSLARLQFLLWLLVIFFGMLHIWIITDVLISPTGSTLLLLGISGGTFYLGNLLDTPSGGGTKMTPEELTTFISTSQSKNLIFDVLNNGQSISLHRLQLLLFTLFLCCYFVTVVIGGLIIPQISDTMLALMGISSTMYAGVKTTES